MLVIGLIAGGLNFLANYSDNTKNVEYTKNKRVFRDNVN
jgi:hypothetical protein